MLQRELGRRDAAAALPRCLRIFQEGTQGIKEVTTATSKRGIANLSTANAKAAECCSGAREAQRNTGTTKVPANL